MNNDTNKNLDERIRGSTTSDNSQELHPHRHQQPHPSEEGELQPILMKPVPNKRNSFTMVRYCIGYMLFANVTWYYYYVM